MMAASFTSGAADNKKIELKEQLLETVKSQKVNFVKVATEFYAKPKRSDQHYIEFCQTIIATIDEVLQAGDWNDSFFLKNTVKPLRELREKAILVLSQIDTTALPDEIQERTLSEDSLLAYVSMFLSDGLNMAKWEMQLRSLERYLIGRPVYQNEADVKTMIRGKVNPDCEAYAIVAVSKKDVQDFLHQAQRKDRNEKPLMSLKQGAIKSDNIIEFVHRGKHYYFVNNRLREKI